MDCKANRTIDKLLSYDNKLFLEKEKQWLAQIERERRACLERRLQKKFEKKMRKRKKLLGKRKREQQAF